VACQQRTIELARVERRAQRDRDARKRARQLEEIPSSCEHPRRRACRRERNHDSTRDARREDHARPIAFTTHNAPRTARAVHGERCIATSAHTTHDPLETIRALSRGGAALDDKAEPRERRGLELAIVREADKDRREPTLTPTMEGELLAMPEGEHPRSILSRLEIWVRDEREPKRRKPDTRDEPC
jgi:hypothetical protein